MQLITTQKVISNNRIFLSPKLRQKLNVTDGDFLIFFEDESERIIVKKVEA